jgi:lysophospholipase L1-like esterase
MRIAILGDSICYGDGVMQKESWVGLLTAALKQTHPGCAVQNAGVNGNTARQGLQRLPGLLFKAPDLLYVQFGLNDAWQGVAVEFYVESMREIVRQALECGTGAVIFAANHRVCVTEEQQEHGGKLYGEAVSFFNKCLREAFAPQPASVTLADMEQFFIDVGAVEAQAELLQYDGVHLSVAGNIAYARWLEPVFRSRLGL